MNHPPLSVASPSSASREQLLLAMAQAGDRRALEQLLRLHRPRIERLCRRMCRGDGSFDDVLQETYLGIVRNIASFRGQSSFLTWVYTVARTYRGRYVRTAARHQARELAASEFAVTPRSVDVEGSIAGAELGGAIHQALAHLSEIDRRILLLRDVDGLTAAEVADVTGLSVPAVKTRLHRARVMARRRLGTLHSDLEPLRPCAA